VCNSIHIVHAFTLSIRSGHIMVASACPAARQLASFVNYRQRAPPDIEISLDDAPPGGDKRNALDRVHQPTDTVTQRGHASLSVDFSILAQ